MSPIVNDMSSIPDWARPDGFVGIEGTAVERTAAEETVVEGPSEATEASPRRARGMSRTTGSSPRARTSSRRARTARSAPATEEAADDADHRGRRRRPTVQDRIEAGELAGAELSEHAREAILRTLTAAPKSRAQLIESLSRKGYPEDVLEPLLDRFEQVGLIDDTEYAGMIVRTRHAERGLSRRAIAQELRRRGIDEETAAGALEQVGDDDEAVAARELVVRRLSRTAGLDREVRIRRVVGALARKGYGPSLALSLVREELAREGQELEDEQDVPDSL